jgi:hypothetical protein
MHRRTLLALAASSLALIGFGLGMGPLLGATPAPADETRISGPVIHENLAIYLIHGKSAPGAVPLTLDEALAKQVVRVHETGNVNQLQIENLGNEEVFVQSGDIVKGGQQDRVLSVSLMLPPKSGRIPIGSFCVEQGRWTARGKEDVATFATASAVVPSREAKIAMKAPMPAVPPAGHLSPNMNQRNSAGSETGSRQQEVWAKVRKVQDGLSNTLGVKVNAPASQSSLQLALENEKLKDAQASYLAALRGAAEKDDDVIGYVFAVNGKLNSAEVYPSSGLFRKMWPKLLQASVTEAIGQKNAGGETTPTVEAASAFLDEARAGKPSEKVLPAAVSVETRDADKALYFETKRADGAWLHRSYLAK